MIVIRFWNVFCEGVSERRFTANANEYCLTFAHCIRIWGLGQTRFFRFRVVEIRNVYIRLVLGFQHECIAIHTATACQSDPRMGNRRGIEKDFGEVAVQLVRCRIALAEFGRFICRIYGGGICCGSIHDEVRLEESRCVRGKA